MNINREFIEEILYEDDMRELYAESENVYSYRLTNLAKEKIASIDSEEDLIVLASNYNWDDGFELPREILKNKNCTLSVATLLFDLADGWDYYSNKILSDSEYAVERNEFIVYLYDKLSANEYDIGRLLEIDNDGTFEKLPEIAKIVRELDICKINI